MRLDRLVSLGISALTPEAAGHRAAILMYHGINNLEETRPHPYFKTSTLPARFAEQMQWLAEAGAEVVTLEAWNAPFTRKKALRVIITFDDGYADFMSNAFPALCARGYPATMFLPTDFIETGKTLSAGVKHLRWDEIQHLSQAGFSFGSHTASHRPLESLSRHEIYEEVRNSAQAISAHLGGKVTSFSCPFAFPQAHAPVISALREALADCGYTVAVTTKIGALSMDDDPYMLRRLPINSDDDKKLFMAKLHGGYDWLGGIQSMVRSAKKALQR